MSAIQSVAKPSKKPKPPSIPPLTRLTARQAGELLGVSHETVYAMAKRGQLPAQPIGVRSWRFFKEPLLQWQREQLSHGLEATP